MLTKIATIVFSKIFSLKKYVHFYYFTIMKVRKYHTQVILQAYCFQNTKFQIRMLSFNSKSTPPHCVMLPGNLKLYPSELAPYCKGTKEKLFFLIVSFAISVLFLYCSSSFHPEQQLKCLIFPVFVSPDSRRAFRDISNSYPDLISEVTEPP